MRHAFVYQKNFYCEPCGGELRQTLARDGGITNLGDSSTYSSRKYPKGPQPLEKPRDVIRNCVKCSAFLLNPLTEAGKATVLENIQKKRYSLATIPILIAEYGFNITICVSCGGTEEPSNLVCSCGRGKSICKNCISKCSNAKCGKILCYAHRKRCTKDGWISCYGVCDKLHMQNKHSSRVFIDSGVDAYEFTSDTDE